MIAREAGTSDARPPARLPAGCILFVIHYPDGHLRLFGGVIEELLERGVPVHVLGERPERSNDTQSWIERMAHHDGFSFEALDVWRREPHERFSRPLRGGVDYLRVVRSSAFWNSPYYAQRARAQAPWAARLVADRLGRVPGALALCALAYRALDRSVPVGEGLAAYLRERAPAALVVGPHLFPGSTHSMWVRAARIAQVPSALAILSWDNLSSKQLIRPQPDRLIVWNDRQRQEAVELHGVPEAAVEVTGAQCFDPWFVQVPTPRQEFCARSGLDPERPFVLFVGGSHPYELERTEAEWFIDWVRALRSSSEAALRDAQILARPHPKRTADWERVDLRQLDSTVVWPPLPIPTPTGRESRQDYFDSLHHCAAVVGINTSAMIEAGIVGKPVCAPLVPEFRVIQDGLSHFRYLLEIGGGLLQVADTVEEHHRQLAAGMAHGDSGRGSAFARAFVRPYGLDRPAIPLFADAVIRLGELEPAADRDGVRTRLIRTVLRAWAATPVRARRARKRIRGKLKQLRLPAR